MAEELKTKKGSELPLADALGDTDQFFGVNQGGVTKRALMSQLSTFFGAFTRAKASTTSVDDFGADNTGSADSAAAFSAAYAYAYANKTKLVGRGVYLLNSPVTMRYVAVDFSACDIKIGHAGIGLVMGGASQLGGAPAQRVGYVYRVGGISAVPTIRLAGAKGLTFYFQRTDYIQIYADTNAVSQMPFPSGSFAYCSVFGNNVEVFELATPDTTDGDIVQWITENDFYINRITTRYTVKGTYHHNHNRLHGGTFENTGLIDFQKGRSNRVYDTRFENAPVVKFATDTYNNLVFTSWVSALSRDPESFNATVTDLGNNNDVITTFKHTREYATVAYADISDVVLNGDQGPRFGRSSDLQRIRGNSVQFACQSGFLPVIKDDFFFFGSDADDALTVNYRTRIDFYNEKLQPIAAAAGIVNSIYFSGSPTANSVNSTGGQRRAWCYFDDVTVAAAKFCKVSWTFSSTQLADGNARALWIKRASKKSSLLGTSAAYAPTQSMLSVVSTAPIAGFAPVGYTAQLNTGASRYICTFSFENSLAAAAASAATAITVNLGTGVAVGDIIGINLTDMTTHWTTVATVSGTAITLTAGLASAAPSGARVVFNRWVTKTP